MSVAKLSITVEEADLEWVRREAKRSKQSISAVVADAIAQKRDTVSSVNEFQAWPGGFGGSMGTNALRFLATL